MNLKELFLKRRGQFWGDILPYLGYVIQSGVAVVFLFALIAFSAWYTSIVQNVPPGLPIRWIMLAVLFPVVVNSSVRTYLRPADPVFLLPQESRMKLYFAKGWVSGVIYKIVLMLIILIILWPLYIRSEPEAKLLLPTALLLIGLKLVSSYGSWKEQFMVSRGASGGYRALRWAVIFLSLAAWLWYAAFSSLIFILLLVATYVASFRLPARHAVAWERLIQVEKRQAARVMMVLSWFVNVPQREQRVYARRWLSRWGSGIPWRRDTAYRFLLVKSLVRSDIFGILLRVVVLGVLLIWLAGGGLAASAIYLICLMITGLQLSALSKLHRESFWLHVYPLPEGTRRANEGKLIFQLHLVWAVILWLPMLPGMASEPGWTLGTGLAGGLLVILFRAAADRRARKDDDDEM